MTRPASIPGSAVASGVLLAMLGGREVYVGFGVELGDGLGKDVGVDVGAGTKVGVMLSRIVRVTAWGGALLETRGEFTLTPAAVSPTVASPTNRPSSSPLYLCSFMMLGENSLAEVLLLERY